MKKIYKSLLAFAAALVLVPTAYAQEPNREIYEFDEVKGIGYNKYLLSTTPNSDGEYTLRIENFITGQVKQNAIPTDFVLVLDNSGSMYYDYLPYGTTNRPMRIPLTDAGLANNSNEKLLLPYLVEGYGDPDVSMGFRPYTGMTYQYEYELSTIGQVIGNKTPRYFYQAFQPETASYGSGQSRTTRYYRYEDPSKPTNNGYYRIFQKMNGSYYNLAIKLADGTYRYLYNDSIQTEPNSVIDASNKIIYNGGNVYHIKSRKEALVEGVHSFLELIEEENAKDHWAKDPDTGQIKVKKHQVSIVSFSSGYQGGGSGSIEEYTGAINGNTKVIKDFTEITEADDIYNVVLNRMDFRGPQTPTQRGIHLARLLLEDLQIREGGKYVALSTSGMVNRNKVVVFFTDGEPYDGSAKFFAITNPTVKDGKVIKEVGIGKINGRIYSIDLRMSSSSKDFLEHLSSNYPKGDCDVDDGNYAAGHFTGKKVPLVKTDVTEDEWKYWEHESPIYYKTSEDGDLRSVFASIAAANTGALSGTLLAVDTMSDSFVMPENVNDPGKVKIYTAQCIGTKTFTVNGEEKEFLAFAEPIQIKDRPSLDHLWCVREVDQPGGGKKAEWVDIAGDYGIDIDSKIDFTTTTDGKKISVSGFQYSDLWCGLDPDPEHDNTRQIETSDPNYGFQKDGYRGFKLIFDFPIKIDPDALGGVNVPTNDWANSGLYKSGETEPEVHYPEPDLPVPVKLVVQKTGLKPGESANFTVQRKHRTEAGATYEDLLTFVITGDEAKTPEVRIINLDPAYYYKVKEENWSWAYTNVHPEYSTETPGAKNPIVFENTPKDDTPKHAEAKADNTLKSW